MRVGNGTSGGVGMLSVVAGGVLVLGALVGDGSNATVALSVGVGTTVGKKLNGLSARHDKPNAANAIPAANITTKGK